MPLDPGAVRKIARLARISIADSEVRPLQDELNGILGWIEQLSEVDVDGVIPLVGVEQTALRLREDVVQADASVDRVLSNAPDREGPFFAVPKVVE
ncbi:Asp-tRNA(Asn)/Glu-tRNA(Gln) amidotransferase subunit GatC [Lichenicoccus sp.]|uniref:Asp-tRNA(Asn)/Glu-tRNA(Gln) amidotransferase subunit GatC n=1 Tax=Lichenicoccus sp. TaxID=2781899 RepID=UPI003D13D06C